MECIKLIKNKMIINTIKKFWNSKKIVTEFKDAQVQSYWVDFFTPIKNKNNKTVLDFGCGGGRYTEMLARMGFKTYAFDLHQSMMDETLQKVKIAEVKAEVFQAEMTNIPFENKMFDIILSNGVLHNAKSLKELKKAISEIVRVIKPNGTLCLNMFYDGGNNSLLAKNKEKYMYTTKDELPMTLLPLKDLEKLFVKYGFKKVGRVITYTRDMEVGTRDVMRGVFKRR